MVKIRCNEAHTSRNIKRDAFEYPIGHLLKSQRSDWYVVERECVLRFDNEAGPGDHRHYGNTERPYRFTTTEQLLADFDSAIARWNHETRDP